ncbi:MAG TPA: flagellar motor protein MotB [Candidatus Hydrogenedentes bacterium]|jgi:chemotaxis protein MotB|nr:flagellar motor protein MotB [Candidatus Hydrogenedentota bacterium]HPJ98116.1 flagellar motor protein MotB [Candidatus Hydrogenedentota bacterium]
MPKGKRNKGGEEQPGAPGWMVTYGDMMSLLLCFFVLLLSFSSVSEKKYSQAIHSLKGALGVLPRNLSVIQPLPVEQMAPKRQRTIERIGRMIQERLLINNKAEDIKIEFDEEGGLKINLPSRILFDTARAELKPDAFPVLEDIGMVLKDLPGASIEIRGHTDIRPLTPGGKFEDNYHLSYGRAKSVMDFLHERAQIPLGVFEVIACGPSQPIATNETEEGMQANRRVEINVRGDFSEETTSELRKSIDQMQSGIGLKPEQ